LSTMLVGNRHFLLFSSVFFLIRWLPAALYITALLVVSFSHFCRITENGALFRDHDRDTAGLLPQETSFRHAQLWMHKVHLFIYGTLDLSVMVIISEINILGKEGSFFKHLKFFRKKLCRH
jgi:hypothetical protein